MKEVTLGEITELYTRAVRAQQTKLAFGLGLIIRVAGFPEKVKNRLIAVAAAVLGTVEAAKEAG